MEAILRDFQFQKNQIQRLSLKQNLEDEIHLQSVFRIEEVKLNSIRLLFIFYSDLFIGQDDVRSCITCATGGVYLIDYKKLDSE